MNNVKCECGKIVCQINDNTILIKCRHCKRFIIIKINHPNTKKTYYDYRDFTKVEYK